MARHDHLSERDRLNMDSFFATLLDGYRSGEVTKEQALSALGHVSAAIDDGNYGEARRCFDQGRKFLQPKPPERTPKAARLFTTGGSQAVRLPADFRFNVDQVYVRRDRRTGDVILSAQARSSWVDFMALRDELGPVPDDFLADRQQGSETRDPLAGWHE